MRTIDLQSELAKKIIAKTRELLAQTNWNHNLSEVTEIRETKDYFDIYVNNRLSASTSKNQI